MKTILYTWFAVLLFGMAAVSCGDDDTKNNDTTGITGSSWKASETVGADRTTKKYTFKASANWVAQSDKPEWCKILTSSGDKGSDRQLNITVEANETGSTRSANITVQVSGYARAAQFAITQLGSSSGGTGADTELNKQVDKILEYYYLWNGEYRQMSRDLSLDYISSSDNFLKRTLLEMTTNDLDKKRQSNGSYSVYSYLLRSPSQLPVERRIPANVARPLAGLHQFQRQFPETHAAGDDDQRPRQKTAEQRQLLGLLLPAAEPLTKAVDGTKPEVNHGVAKKKEYGFGIAGLMGVRFVDGNNQPTGEYGLVVTSVYPDSPASEAGFRRGTFFAQYNGAAITAANLNSVYGTLIAPGGASTVKLTENKQGAQPVSLTAREIYPNPVIHSEVITSGAHRIGYLVYDSFDAAYDDELLAAVKKLKDGNITDMVLDLRNNGGGHVISSNMLSTCIAGAACQGKVYEYYRYNDSRMATVEKTARETGKEYDTAAKKFFDEFYYGDYYGVDLRNYALNMTRLYVLVTGNTASSSEAVINTLRGLDGFTVKLIGEKTNGKNVGMEVSKFTVGNYSYELAPISFQGYNAKQVTVDKNGLAVDTACEEWDGELKDYGDRSEPMLAAALSQITGQRSASVSGTRSTAPGVRPATDIALPDLSNRPNGMIVFLPAAEE